MARKNILNMSRQKDAQHMKRLEPTMSKVLNHIAKGFQVYCVMIHADLSFILGRDATLCKKASHRQ